MKLNISYAYSFSSLINWLVDLYLENHVDLIVYVQHIYLSPYYQSFLYNLQLDCIVYRKENKIL